MNSFFGINQDDLDQMHAQLELRPFPRDVIMEATAACNLDCIMCRNAEIKGSRGNASTELWDRVIEEIAATDRETRFWLTFYGEALVVYPRLIYGLKKAVAAGLPHTFLNTNGMLLTGDKFTELADLGLANLVLSIDAISTETYVKIRRGGDKDQVYAHALQAISLNNQRPNPLNIEIQMIQMPENEAEVDGFIEFWHAQGVRVKIKRFLNWTHHDEAFAQGVSPFKRIGCGWAMNTSPILANGDVVACGDDYSGKLIYGNVFQESLRAIWARKMEDLKFHLNKKFDKLPDLCQHCTDWFVIKSRVIEPE